jgi:hypothetical protein
MPKPPKTDPVVFLPPAPQPKSWPFFPAPLPQLIRLVGLSLVPPKPGQGRPAVLGQMRPWVIRWENERGALIDEIGDRRVRLAVKKAVARKANIYSLFPDALDHLHIDVRPMTISPKPR